MSSLSAIERFQNYLDSLRNQVFILAYPATNYLEVVTGFPINDDNLLKPFVSLKAAGADFELMIKKRKTIRVELDAVPCDLKDVARLLKEFFESHGCVVTVKLLLPMAGSDLAVDDSVFSKDERTAWAVINDAQPQRPAISIGEANDRRSTANEIPPLNTDAFPMTSRFNIPADES